MKHIDGILNVYNLFMYNKSVFISLNRRNHLEMFRINQTREKFSFLRLTSCPDLPPGFFVLFLFICILFFVETLGLTLQILPSSGLFVHPPIPHILVNFLFKSLISSSNLFEQYDMIAFLLTQYSVPAAFSDNHIHMVTQFSYSYSMGPEILYINVATIAYRCGFV